MPSVSDPKFWVLNQSQIAARRSPFLSDTFIFNTTTKSLRLGPGMWANCAVLIEPGGGGDGQLTADQLAAVLAATSPSASNAFITASVLAAGLATKDPVFRPYFTAVVNGVTKTYRQGVGTFGGKPWYYDVNAVDPTSDNFQFVITADPNGTWVLLVGGVTTATETSAGNRDTPQDVTAWTSTTPILSAIETTSQAAIEAVAAKLVGPVFNTQSGTTYATVLSDVGKTINCTNSGAVAVTINHAGVRIRQGGTGQVTLTAGSGKTLTTTAPATYAQYSILEVIQSPTANTFDVCGQME